MARLVVLGAGESGIGTAILGKKQGYEVFVSDNGQIQNKYKDVLKNLEVEWEEEGHSEELITNADVVMKSPGIPDKVPVVQRLNSLLAIPMRPLLVLREAMEKQRRPC